MRGFMVQLSDGSFITEEDMSWLKLQDYLLRADLKVIGIWIQYDESSFHLPPREAKHVFFYSKKIEALLGGSSPAKQYYGIGAASVGDDRMTIYWFDPESDTFVSEERQIDFGNRAFIR